MRLLILYVRNKFLGEHWFYTEKQMEFLNNWIKNLIKKPTATILF